MSNNPLVQKFFEFIESNPKFLRNIKMYATRKCSAQNAEDLVNDWIVYMSEKGAQNIDWSVEHKQVLKFLYTSFANKLLSIKKKKFSLVNQDAFEVVSYTELTTPADDDSSNATADHDMIFQDQHSVDMFTAKEMAMDLRSMLPTLPNFMAETAECYIDYLEKHAEFANFSYKDLSVLLGLPQLTAGGRIYRVIKAFKDYLGDEKHGYVPAK